MLKIVQIMPVEPGLEALYEDLDRKDIYGFALVTKVSTQKIAPLIFEDGTLTPQDLDDPNYLGIVDIRTGKKYYTEAAYGESQKPQEFPIIHTIIGERP